MDQSDAESVGIFSQWTNQTQKAWAYSHDGPINCRQDKRSLKLDLKEMELAHEDVVRQLKLDNAKEITKLRQEFELNARELQNKYEKKVRLSSESNRDCRSQA
eukprot:1194441-Prorocentrum_minimum.AAC.2